MQIEKQASKLLMHMCVWLITVSLLLIICTLLIYPCIVCKRCYTARTRRHETSYVHAAYETSTPVVYTCFIEVFSVFLEFFDFGFFLSVWVESRCLFIYVCLVIFFIICDIGL